MNQILQCPHCKHDKIHQIETQLYCREEEKDEVLVLVGMYTGMISQAKASQTNRSISIANPSVRRQGMRVIFKCEGCDEYPQLVLHQHKGDSTLQWELG